MSNFGSLRIALTSLAAAQKGLEIAGHNVANAKSPGYTRQQVVTTADGGPSIAAMYARWQQGGYGVKGINIQRVNDVFLTNRTYIEHAASGVARTSADIFAQLEQVFPEPGPNGLQQQLTDFWSAWDDVANQPQDTGARAQLLARTNVLLDKIHQSANDMYDLANDVTERLDAAVDQVNSLIDQIASLNATIAASSGSGRTPNDLLDQRDQLVRQLSDLADVTVRYDENDLVDVFIPGGPILMGTTTFPLTMTATGSGAAVQFANGGGGDQVFNGGRIAAFLGAINDVIPTFVGSLDAMTNNLRNTVNGALGVTSGSVGATIGTAGQNLAAVPTLTFDVRINGGAWATVTLAGADFSGAGGAAALQTALQTALGAVPLTASVTGGNGSAMTLSLASGDADDIVEVRPFTSGGSEQPGLAQLFPTLALDANRVGGAPFFTGSGASGIALNADMAANPMRIAVGRSTAGANDGAIALALAELGSGVGGPDADYRALLATLGAASQRAARIADNQDVMTTQVDAAKDAATGVNIDEEMIAMVQYQHAYSASARFLGVIDDVLNTLLNAFGR